MRSDPFSPRTHLVRWRGTTPTVPYPCSCGQTVDVEGVTTIDGAIAALARSGQHQH
ncbi:hypothetical protein [Nonomuraea sp. NPDC050643]|uniref:hypothetical protein n=1 Tax=Nonomuraea sp. NPDC050643 TaxID=3155660 RepID=UPI0033C527AA